MSDSLSFGDHLLARARLMLRLGRRAQARRLLKKLVGHPEQSHRLRADAFRLLADLEIEVGRFKPARRNLVAAIQLRRHADELYVQYARMVEADPDADPRLAVKAMRRAVGIDPFEPRSWAVLGTAAHNAGDHELARKALRRAAKLRPEDADTLAEIAEGMLKLGCETDARTVLTAAQFRLSNRADIAALCSRFGFEVAARNQRRTKDKGETAKVLPFPAPTDVPSQSEGPSVVLRTDRPSTPRPHLFRMFGPRPGPRQAN